MHAPSPPRTPVPKSSQIPEIFSVETRMHWDRQLLRRDSRWLIIFICAFDRRSFLCLRLSSTGAAIFVWGTCLVMRCIEVFSSSLRQWNVDQFHERAVVKISTLWWVLWRSNRTNDARIRYWKCRQLNNRIDGEELERQTAFDVALYEAVCRLRWRECLVTT